MTEIILTTQDQLKTLITKCIQESVKPETESQELKIYDKKAAAAILKIGVSTLDQWRTRGIIKSITPIGSKVLFDDVAIEQCVQSLKKISNS